VAVAAKSEVKDKDLTPTTAPTPAPTPATSSTAPTPAPTGDDGRIKTDFNNESTTTEPIQLR
jgi:hypothetical protein